MAQPTSYTLPSLPGRKAQVELRKTMERVGMNERSVNIATFRVYLSENTEESGLF